jgi:acetolactate synthase-1/2/3 large subunit
VVPPRPRTQPSAADVENVVKLLVGAACPVVSTDDAGRDPAAFAALVELAEVLGMPVIEGPASACANFPRRHDLHLGSDFSVVRDAADVVLLVASRAPWYPPGAAPPGATIVAVSENPLKGHVVYQSLQADIYLEGDVAATLRLLTAAVREAGGSAQAGERRVRWAREHARQSAGRRAAEQAVRENTPIDPLHLLAELRAALPGDAIVVEETVLHAALAQRHMEWNAAQTFFHPRGGLGQALGMALGCKLAAPQRTVVALVGDGALLYNPVVQAFGASRSENLPLLIVVFNNRGYAAMRENHRSYYPDGVAVRADVWHGVKIDGPDYAELGRPFGFGGRLVERPGEVGAALREGLAEVGEGRSFIVNVVLSR